MSINNIGGVMPFQLPKDRSSIIKVIGVGGGGGNAVKFMHSQGIEGVDFLVCNTDRQALEDNPIPTKIQLGLSLTEGLGAGAQPEIGRNAALESIEEIQNALKTNTKMVFVTAGMGGGTGTGAAPVIAQIAKEMGILTVGIVTMPFSFEGKRRLQQAQDGLNEMKKHVDTVLIIQNDKLRSIHGDLKLSQAFSHADNVLTTAAKSISEIITKKLDINVDFADVNKVLKGSGVAIMGHAVAKGQNRAEDVVRKALESPLLNDSNIHGAKHILINIVSGEEEITMTEFETINTFVQDEAGQNAELIMGSGNDSSLGEYIAVTIIATGFKTNDQIRQDEVKANKVEYTLEVKQPQVPVQPLLQPLINQQLNVNPQPAINQEPFNAPVQPQVSTSQTTEFKLEVKPSTPAPEAKPEHVLPPQYSFSEPQKKVEHLYSQTAPVSSASEQTNRPVQNSNTEPDLFNNPASQNENWQEKQVSQEKRFPFVPANNDDSNQDFQANNRFSKAADNLNKLRENTLKSFRKLDNELDPEPAYKSKGIQVDQSATPNMNNVSRYTIGEDDLKRPEIKPNNPFLHDNVD